MNHEQHGSGSGSLLDALAPNGSAGVLPRAFERRVRRRRIVRTATHACIGAVATVVVAATTLAVMREETERATPPRTVVQRTQMPELGPGGPALPVRAGMRPSDPMASVLLQ